MAGKPATLKTLLGIMNFGLLFLHIIEKNIYIKLFLQNLCILNHYIIFVITGISKLPNPKI